MLKSKNVRIMLVLLVIGLLYVFVFGCEPTGGSAFVDGASEDLVGWGNDLADNIDSTCEEAGIPRCLSCEIYNDLNNK